MPKEINELNFESEVIKASKPVLVDFWAPWCGPCQRMAPILEEVETLFSGRIEVKKVNVDENAKLAQRYQIMSIPTLMIFKDGNVIDRIIGLTPLQELEKVLEKYVEKPK